MSSEKSFAQELLKEKAFLIEDEYHVWGITKSSNINHDVLKEKYGQISFSFDFIKRIEQLVRGLCDDRLADVQINMMTPKSGDGLLVFKIRMPKTFGRNAHDDHPNDYVILLAPRKEIGQVVYPSLHDKKSEADV